MPNAVLGSRLVVFTAWLHYLIGISVNNLTKMVNIFANFKVSAGGLTQAWKNLALRLEEDYNEIRRKIYHSAVLHADETGWRINGDTFWLWCFATKEACYYIITKSRGSPVIEDFLGIFFNGILICDFWPAYNMISALAKQRCFYHLFTELVKVDKYNPSTEWKSFRKKLSRLLKDALRLSERRAHKNVDVYEGLKGKLHARLNSLLSEEYQDRDVKRIIKRLKRHKDEMFTFLDYEGVSPYNNYAEQQMRNAVIVRKISQQNRSLKGARTQSILMSLFRTAQLRGENPVEYVLALVKKAIQVAAYQKEQGKAAA
jgi:hypothetical protein